MRIFGRKANQQSAKPDVPPELQPYFDGKTFRVRLRHTIGRLLPLIVATSIVAAAILGAYLWRGRLNGIINHSAKPPKQSQTTQTANNTNQPNTPTPNAPAPGTTSTPPVITPPTPSPTSTATPAPVATNQPSHTSSSSSVSAPTFTTTPISTIPNTGPGETALVASAGAALLGAFAYHLRQVRALKR